MAVSAPPLVSADLGADQLSCYELHVPLLATDEMLQCPVQGPVRAPSLIVEPRRIQRAAELEKSAVRPRVVTEDVLERRLHVWRIGLPRLMKRPRPLRPRNLSFSTITSPRDITTTGLPFTLRPSYGL